MNIPESVKIGYKIFDVNKIETNVISDNKVCYGEIQYDNGIINISKKYSEDQQKCTFLHEVIHGIDDIFEIGLEEDQVRKIAKGIYLLIKDNSEIFMNNTFDKTQPLK
ncbi:hypothetical protein [Clostridium pasteurianum]|uniref:Phage protein n=1 Tax=Clostridium pasteurianum BC1 TaxID=86416 RepID=R4KCQ5_CLOPA|nr:hypothetical protein [Clostridium pasteurianum]AGK97400.1 hypothetical protein Clopa_2540 [Clostridium pasteurianum BC1]